MATVVYGKSVSQQIKKDIKVIDKKIYGLNYPIGDNRGYFSKQTGTSLVRGNLTQVLKTERGERVMLPNYGCNLRKYLFEPLDEATFVSIKNEILTSISRYVPYVEVVKLMVVNQEDINLYGASGFKITLVVKMREPDSSLIETTVEIG